MPPCQMLRWNATEESDLTAPMKLRSRLIVFTIAWKSVPDDIRGTASRLSILRPNDRVDSVREK